MEPALILILALALDATLGEPDWAWRRWPHPAVLIGQAIGWADHRFNRGEGRMLKGALLVAALIAGGWIIGRVMSDIPDFGVLEVIAAAVILAQRSLADHVGAVADGLRYGTDAGRMAVARIVGRDTADMDDPAIARAAIESAAENFSDGVIAPVFWLLIGGLPGMLIYKAVNTADSMIGYRTPRHADFGFVAAKLDDLMNWVPARLTGYLFLAVAGRWDGAAVMHRDAPLHRSPNAGWPEAAMAAALGVAVSGPRSYAGETRDFHFVNAQGRRDAGAGDIDAAVALLWRGWWGLIAATALWLVTA